MVQLFCSLRFFGLSALGWSAGLHSGGAGVQQRLAIARGLPAHRLLLVPQHPPGSLLGALSSAPPSEHVSLVHCRHFSSSLLKRLVRGNKHPLLLEYEINAERVDRFSSFNVLVPLRHLVILLQKYPMLLPYFWIVPERNCKKNVTQPAQTPPLMERYQLLSACHRD